MGFNYYVLIENTPAYTSCTLLYITYACYSVLSYIYYWYTARNVMSCNVPYCEDRSST